MWAKWTQVATVASTETMFSAVATQLALDMRKKGLQVTAQSQFRTGAFGVGELGRVAAARLRVIVVIACSIDVVAVALPAKDQGMLDAGWAWLGLDTVAGAETFAAGGREATEAAKAALCGWLYFQPSNVAPAAFFDRVREATRARFPLPPGSDDVLGAALTPFAANMYDAVVLYAMAIAHKSSRLSNGALTLKSMRNVSFDGMTGRVELDENGDMKESVSAMNYVMDNGTMQGRKVGSYDGLSRDYSPHQDIAVVWPGGIYAAPADLAEAENGFDTKWILFGGAATAVIVVSGLVVFVRRKHSHLQAILTSLFAEVGELVGYISMELADFATDCIACHRILQGDFKASQKLYNVAYVTALMFGAVGTVFSIAYRLQSALQVRADVKKMVLKQGRGQEISEARRMMHKFEWELAQTHRTKIALSLALMTIVAQGPCRVHRPIRSQFRHACHVVQICQCRSSTSV
jgi:hypothetical protein